MTGNRQPTTDERPQLSVTVSVREIYAAVCPACQQAILDLISGKANAGLVRESVKRQLEASAHPERVEGPQGEHS